MHLSNVSPDPLAPLSPITNLSLSSSSPHRILIVGGAYAGIAAVLNLLDLQQGKQERPSGFPLPKFNGAKSKRGIEITVLDERDGFFHSVGAPLAHVAPPHTPTMWKRYTHLNELKHPNLNFIHGSVSKVRPSDCIAEYTDKKTGETKNCQYDYLILASGLRRHWPAVPKKGVYEDYMKDGLDLIQKIAGGENARKEKAKRRVVVIGAGAVGIEFAAEISHNHPHIHTTLIHSRPVILSSEPLPDSVKHRAKLILEEEGVKVITGNRATVTIAPNGQSIVTLADGTEVVADAVLDMTRKGTSSAKGFLEEKYLDGVGEVKTSRALEFPEGVKNRERHFAAGDVVRFDGIKRAGGAMVMGQIAANNLWVNLLREERADSGSRQKDEYEMAQIPDYPVVIGLAIGKQCLTFDGKEERWGEKLMRDYFGEDLGWQGSLKWLGLTDVVEEKEMRKGDKQVEIAVKEVVEGVENQKEKARVVFETVAVVEEMVVAAA